MKGKDVFQWRIAVLVGLALAAVALGVMGCTGVATAGGGGSTPPRGDNTGYVLNSISVTGTGDAQGEPDVANVQLGIDVAEGDIGVAIKNANDVMNKVQDAVRQQGIDPKDMQTVNFNVYPEDVYDKQTGQPTGQRRYHVQNFLNVKVKDITKVGAVIDAGLSAGATNVNSLSFNVEDTSKLEAEARSKALKDAQARAQQLADGLGVKLGKPIIVSETLGGGGPIVPVFAAPAAADGKGGGAPPISSGQQTVTITVNVTFAIAQ